MRDRPFYLPQTAGAKPGISERSGLVRDVGPGPFPGGLVPARPTHLDTEPLARGREDVRVLQRLSTLRLSFPCHRGSVARAALLPASAMYIGLAQGRRARLIVCRHLGSGRDSGWLGNKAAAWPRGQPADTKPSTAIHCGCEKPARAPGPPSSPPVLILHFLTPQGIISSPGEAGLF